MTGKYGKLFKHKRKPNKVRSPYSENTSKVVYTYGDGAVKRQSHLSGAYQTTNKKGRVIKNR